MSNIIQKVKEEIVKPLFFSVFKAGASVKNNAVSSFLIASAYFIKAENEYNNCGATIFKEDRYKLHDFLSREYLSPDEKILFFEFGVRWGTIINKWAGHNKNKESVFAGFDTFTGLPEDWGNVKKGSLSNDGEVPTPADERVHFYVGLVQDTLPVYLSNIDENTKKVIHFDFDLYSATLFSLLQLTGHMKKGDVIIFDQYFSVTKNHHEYRAFRDYLSVQKLNYIPKYKTRDGKYVIELC